VKQVHIGAMRHRLALQTPVSTPDGGGGTDKAWSLVAEVWGSIEPASGGEQVAADGLSGAISHEVWIRHRAGVLPEMRFVLGSRAFEIRAVLDEGERHRVLRCLVDERVP